MTQLYKVKSQLMPRHLLLIHDVPVIKLASLSGDEVT